MFQTEGSMSIEYYYLPPEKIVQDILSAQRTKKITIRNILFSVLPNVYPSDQFRSTNFLLDSIMPLCRGKSFCDMGCGLGVNGIMALKHQAKRVVQGDINPHAIENAQENKKLHGYSDKQLSIFQSDCFDGIPREQFDIHVFNIPFHSEFCVINNPLDRAFHDPGFETLQKYLRHLKKYCHSNSQIFIIFSNKGDTSLLETHFANYGFSWELWKQINTDKKYDNRIYRLACLTNDSQSIFKKFYYWLLG